MASIAEQVSAKLLIFVQVKEHVHSLMFPMGPSIQENLPMQPRPMQLDSESRSVQRLPTSITCFKQPKQVIRVTFQYMSEEGSTISIVRDALLPEAVVGTILLRTG